MYQRNGTKDVQKMIQTCFKMFGTCFILDRKVILTYYKDTENPSLGEATVPPKMARDEARHGRGLEGLLKRYFK